MVKNVYGGIVMAQMYFYKFNINSDIYDVYRDATLQEKVLNKVFESITSDFTCTQDYKEPDGLEKTVEYKFCDLEKDISTLKVTGRLVKIFDGETQTYNRIKDTVDIKYEEDKAASATFCFDILNEEIAFITRQGLRYLQFGKYFMDLLEMKFPENSFKLVLEKNVGELRSKVLGINRILKMSSEMIPPNANEEEFGILLGASVDEFKETKATKYSQSIEVPVKGKNAINPNTKFFERLFFAIGRGYATMTVEGRDKENTKVIVNSDEDAPYKIPIPEKEKDSITAFKERASLGITKLIRDKSKLKLRETGEIDGGEEKS